MAKIVFEVDKVEVASELNELEESIDELEELINEKQQSTVLEGLPEGGINAMKSHLGAFSKAVEAEKNRIERIDIGQ